VADDSEQRARRWSGGVLSGGEAEEAKCGRMSGLKKSRRTPGHAEEPRRGTGEPEQRLSTGGARWQFQAMAERRGMRGRRQWGGAEAVAGLAGDAWSGTGAGAGLERAATAASGGAAAAAGKTEEEERGGEILGSYETKVPSVLKLK
jgi:hypothetical protein